MPTGPVPYTDFAIHVAPTAEGGTDVTIFGELDLATIDQAQVAIAEAVMAEGDVVIDLRACGFVDSRGIAVLVKAALRLSEQGRRLHLRGVQPRVMRTLQIAGLTKLDLLEVEPEGGEPGKPT
jgi:anti-sigma B factor antagonist